jgi:hypothetical protein
MNSGLVWTIVGSVAGVIAVVAAVVFGVAQMRQAGRSSKTPGSGLTQIIRAGRDAYAAGGSQYIGPEQERDE